MTIAFENLPDDVQALKQMLLEREVEITARQAELAAHKAEADKYRAAVTTYKVEIELLKVQIARLRRMKFGRSSEQLDAQISQLELLVEELETTHAELPKPPAGDQHKKPPKKKAARKPLPEHLERETIVSEPACDCPACGAAMAKIGEDVSEVLERVPAHFKVIRYVRPKMSCTKCDTIVQEPAPSLPIDRGLAGPALLAHVMVSKFVDHLPLYRQSQMFEREQIDLSRSTLADCVGGVNKLIQPLIDALGRYVLAAEKLHADDTPVPVLEPGRGTTRTGRLWAYVRDDRPAGHADPPAVWFRYSPDRKGERPRLHLKDFRGILQADGYAGFDQLYQEGKIVEAACWAHARRKFYDILEASKSPIAAEAIERIGQLYGVERDIRGLSADQRGATRQLRAKPILDELHAWLISTLATVSGKSDLAGAIRYALSRWPALTLYCNDGRVEIDNNAVKRAIRAVALGRKNYLFAGSDAGGHRAATMYSLLGTAKLNGVDPEAYLTWVLERIADYPINQVEALLPWHFAEQLPVDTRLAA